MKKVLVIDDDIAFNAILKEQLECANYLVQCAYDGKQGLEVYQAFEPDIVITDIIMPNTDGIEVILTLVNDQSRSCKIIVISGGGKIAGMEYLKLSRNFGVEHILEKPFAFSELQQALETD